MSAEPRKYRSTKWELPGPALIPLTGEEPETRKRVQPKHVKRD